uniref:Ig-like domain-containing protein n=1 Tax=Neogobius melanostomus TaxID=47308 RepID=A0A8C6U6S0_9GOBI
MVTFTKGLESQEAVEGSRATLLCETSSADCRVSWRKGTQVLSHGDKYSIEEQGAAHSLVIHRLSVGDGGEYTCDTGDEQTTASLTVKGKNISASAIFTFSTLHLCYESCYIVFQSQGCPNLFIVGHMLCLVHNAVGGKRIQWHSPWRSAMKPILVQCFTYRRCVNRDVGMCQ